MIFMMWFYHLMTKTSKHLTTILTRIQALRGWITPNWIDWATRRYWAKNVGSTRLTKKISWRKLDTEKILAVASLILQQIERPKFLLRTTAATPDNGIIAFRSEEIAGFSNLQKLLKKDLLLHRWQFSAQLQSGNDQTDTMIASPVSPWKHISSHAVALCPSAYCILIPTQF